MSQEKRLDRFEKLVSNTPSNFIQKLNEYKKSKTIKMSNTEKQLPNNISFHEAKADSLREVINDFVPALLEIKLQNGGNNAYLYARNFADKIIAKSEIAKKTSCSSSCSFCCHDTIYVSHDEGEHIKTVIKAKGIVPNATRLTRQKHMNPNIKWVDKACPLLSEENEKGERLCSIYEDRPMICRTHNSTEDPKNCDKSVNPNKTVGELKIVLLEGVVMSSMIAGNKTGAKEQDCLIALHNIL